MRPALLFIKEWEMQLQMFSAKLRINAHSKEQMLVYFLLADHVDYYHYIYRNEIDIVIWLNAIVKLHRLCFNSNK